MSWRFMPPKLVKDLAPYLDSIDLFLTNKYYHAFLTKDRIAHKEQQYTSWRELPEFVKDYFKSLDHSDSI